MGQTARRRRVSREGTHGHRVWKSTAETTLPASQGLAEHVGGAMRRPANGRRIGRVRLAQRDEGSSRGRAKHLPPAHRRGPGPGRAGVHRTFTIGRAVYKARMTTPGLRDRNGEIVTCPKAVDQMLWASRKDIWTQNPPQGTAGKAILDHYFEGGQGLPSSKNAHFPGCSPS